MGNILQMLMSLMAGGQGLQGGGGVANSMGQGGQQQGGLLQMIQQLMMGGLGRGQMAPSRVQNFGMPSQSRSAVSGLLGGSQPGGGFNWGNTGSPLGLGTPSPMANPAGASGQIAANQAAQGQMGSGGSSSGVPLMSMLSSLISNRGLQTQPVRAGNVG